MIIGNLISDNLDTELLPPIIKETLNLLKKTNFNNLENIKYKIIGDEIFLIIDEYYTKNPNKGNAEQHRIYIDIQYILSGEENIGVCYNDNENEILNSYNPDKDIILFKTVKNENLVTLKKGMYAIFFPTDIHKPGLSIDKEQKVRKIIVKIDKNLLHQKNISPLEIQ